MKCIECNKIFNTEKLLRHLISDHNYIIDDVLTLIFIQIEYLKQKLDEIDKSAQQKIVEAK